MSFIKDKTLIRERHREEVNAYLCSSIIFERFVKESFMDKLENIFQEIFENETIFAVSSSIIRNRKTSFT